MPRKATANTIKVIVRTDAVHVAGTHYTYGQVVALPAADAKSLLAQGLVEAA